MQTLRSQLGKRMINPDSGDLSSDSPRSATFSPTPDATSDTVAQEERAMHPRGSIVHIVDLWDFLTAAEGSVLKCWRKHMDLNGEGRTNEFQFVRALRSLKYPGDPIAVFNSLDDDGSGELSLEEFHFEANALWVMFVDWCATTFRSAENMHVSLSASGRKEPLGRMEFTNGLTRHGWIGGAEALLFSALDTSNDGEVGALEFKWVDVEMRRRQRKMDAKLRAMRDKKKQQYEPRVVASTLEEFKKFLHRRFGGLVRAWRNVISPNDHVSVSRTQFLSACSQLGFQNAAKVLWRSFGKDDSSNMSIDFLDPEAAEMLAHFQLFVQQNGGVKQAFRKLDKKDTKRIKLHEFAEAIRSCNLNLPAKPLFHALDRDGNERLEEEDMMFLERWKLPEFLTSLPNLVARDELKDALIRQYGTFLKSWRVALDEDNSNRCSWTEFQAACKKVNYTGDIPGAWRALDLDLGGSITLNELDAESSGILERFKTWADTEFGGVRSAFGAFDEDASNSITLKEWRHACRIYGFNNGAVALFKELDVEGNGTLAVEELSFLDEWGFLPDKEQTPDTLGTQEEKRKARLRRTTAKSQEAAGKQDDGDRPKSKKVVRKLQGLVPPERVWWNGLPCKSPRASPRGPGTGVPRAWCALCNARGPCRHFSRKDGAGSASAYVRYENLFSPDPDELLSVRPTRSNARSRAIETPWTARVVAARGGSSVEPFSQVHPSTNLGMGMLRGSDFRVKTPRAPSKQSEELPAVARAQSALGESRAEQGADKLRRGSSEAVRASTAPARANASMDLFEGENDLNAADSLLRSSDFVNEVSWQAPWQVSRVGAEVQVMALEEYPLGTVQMNHSGVLKALEQSFTSRAPGYSFF